MGREEREVNAVLWARFDDAAISDISARIVADIPPARMAQYAVIIVPALNPSELGKMEASRRAA
jgi:hypothetical protein